MKVRKKDVIWSYLARTFSLSVNVILLPLIMRFLSDTDLGLWYVFASISQVVNLFDFGFNATLSRHMTYAWSGASKLEKTNTTDVISEGKNYRLIKTVIQTCRVVYFLISLLALVVMLSVGSIYIKGVLRNDFIIEYKIAWLIYSGAVFVNLFYGYWASLLQGIGAVAERNKMNVFAKIIQLLLATILLFMGAGLIGFVISYAISGMVLRFLGKYYFRRKLERIKLSYDISQKDIKDCFSAVWATAWKDGLVMMAQYLSTQANTLICAYYIDLSATSSYGVITQIASVLSSMAMAYYSAYQPMFSSLCLKRDNDGQKKIVGSSSFVYKVIFLLGTLAFVGVGVPLLKIIRPGMTYDYILIVAVCLFYYLYNQHALFASMIASFNEIPYYKSYVISALFSVLISLIVTKFMSYGLWGLVCTQIIVNLIYNNWKWPSYLLKKINMKYYEIYSVGFNEMKLKIRGIMA